MASHGLSIYRFFYDGQFPILTHSLTLRTSVRSDIIRLNNLNKFTTYPILFQTETCLSSFRDTCVTYLSMNYLKNLAAQ